MPVSIRPGDGDAPSERQEKVGCCGWLQWELPCCCGAGGSMFGPEDPNGRTLDLERSFCTGAHRCGWDFLFLKFLIWGLTVSTYIYGFLEYTFPHWFMAYISYWTLLYSCVYMTLSLILGFLSNPPVFLIRATWVMYTNSVVHGLLVVLLFWFTEFGPNYTLSYFIVMSHAGTFVLAVVDGLVINRTPVRLRHYIFVAIFGLIFVGWTILEAYGPIQNPWYDDEEDGSLYNILDWQSSPLEAAIVCVVVVFVAMPIFTLLFWGLSLCNREYVRDLETGTSPSFQSKVDDPEPKVDDPEIQVMESATA